MLRWLVDLDCDDTVVVLTTGEDPTVGHSIIGFVGNVESEGR